MKPRVSRSSLIAMGVVLASGCMGKSTQRQMGNEPTPPDYSSTTGVGKLESGQIPRRVRRLSNREYNNVVRDLLGDQSRPASDFLDDSYANGFDNGSALLTVQTDQALRYQAAAETLAQRAVARHFSELVGGCIPSDLNRLEPRACFDGFLDRFGARAFRRPLAPAERQRFVALFSSIDAEDGFQAAVQTVLEAMLQSPAFLYRGELGGPVDPVSGKVKLTGFELASELSFFLTGSMPDEALIAAAAEGRLETSEDLQREAARLIQTPAARENVRQFIREWLAIDRLGFVTKDARVYPNFNRSLASSMEQELDLFVDQVLWNGSGTLRELFTSDTLYPDERLATIYGISGAAGFLPRRLDSPLRNGIMARAGFLTVHSGTSNSSPVERGVFVRQAFLCTRLPPPPPDVLQQAMMRPPDPSLTTRERQAQHSSDPFCNSCHRLIDPIGFGFEEFDGMGVFRDTENGRPVDSSGVLVGTEDIDGPYTGAAELGAKLASSRQFQKCSVTQLFRFAMGQGETEGDAAAIYSIAQRSALDRSIVDLFSTFAASPLFTERVPEPN